MQTQGSREESHQYVILNHKMKKESELKKPRRHTVYGKLPRRNKFSFSNEQYMVTKHHVYLKTQMSRLGQITKYQLISDLLPVSSGEFLSEGADGVLELQDTGVSLCKGGPQALELLRQTFELCFCLFQLDLTEKK